MGRDLFSRSRPRLTRSAASNNCYRDVFSDVLLLIVYSVPVYGSIPILQSLYQGAFPHIRFCGPRKTELHDIIVVNISRGIFSYECLGEAIRRNPGFEGYLYINDDVIVNWWNLVTLNRTKIWQGNLIENGLSISSSVEEAPKNWMWWRMKIGLPACKMALEDIENARAYHLSQNDRKSWNITHALNTLRQNGNGQLFCCKGWSDIFYIPSQYASAYSDLSAIFYKRRVFLEIAATTIISMLDLRSNNINLDGIYLPKLGIMDGGIPAVVNFKPNAPFIHPFKLHKKAKPNVNRAVVENFITPFSKKLTSCKFRNPA